MKNNFQNTKPIDFKPESVMCANLFNLVFFPDLVIFFLKSGDFWKSLWQQKV